MVYEIVKFDSDANFQDYREMFIRKLENRKLKVLLFVEPKDLLYHFYKVLNFVIEYALDGIVYKKDEQDPIFSYNIELFVKYLSYLPEPYNTPWICSNTTSDDDLNLDNRIEYPSSKFAKGVLNTIVEEWEALYLSD